jgi:hypothetical protein
MAFCPKGKFKNALASVLLGQKRGRQNKNQITIFDSTGLAVHDIATAGFVYGQPAKKYWHNYCPLIFLQEQITEISRQKRGNSDWFGGRCTNLFHVVNSAKSLKFQQNCVCYPNINLGA